MNQINYLSSFSYLYTHTHHHINHTHEIKMVVSTTKKKIQCFLCLGFGASLTIPIKNETVIQVLGKNSSCPLLKLLFANWSKCRQ